MTKKTKERMTWCWLKQLWKDLDRDYIFDLTDCDVSDIEILINFEEQYLKNGRK